MLQIRNLMHKALITIVGAAAIALSTFAVADDKEKPSFAPNVPHPTNGTTECVEDEDEMKKNHMKYILHQRDATMHEGIRTETYSLKECINCHVPKNSEIRYGDDKHFCSSCHNYAGVSIDCFQCHTDRPMGENPHKKNNAQVSKPVKAEVADITAGASNEQQNRDCKYFSPQLC